MLHILPQKHFFCKATTSSSLSGSLAINRNTSPQPFRYSQSQWANLYPKTPLPITEEELKNLRGVNEKVSLMEVERVYLPLCQLIYSHLNMHNLYKISPFLQPLAIPKNKNTFILGIAGSVAVGKSTLARILKTLLERQSNISVDLVTTDGFLYPLNDLKKKELLTKKGFPPSYDIKLLHQFLKQVKNGAPRISVPKYSHITYDRIYGETQLIQQPNILILEGLNVLQKSCLGSHTFPASFVSHFLDLSVYLDSPSSYIHHWYIKRFMTFRQNAFLNPNNYFHHYSKLPIDQALKIANRIWMETNATNLRKNINPSKQYADIVLKKSFNHEIHEIELHSLPYSGEIPMQ